MTRLAFVIGGAQRSGTSTLNLLFRTHNGIQLSSKKETHFFDDEARDWAAPEYSALDAFFPETDGRLRGEATPITLYWRPALARLRAYNPGIKLIFILRDPVQRAFSQWRMMHAAGKDALPFARAIREGRARVCAEAEVEDLHREFSYVERGFYAAQLREVFKLFPARNVHCEIFEEFFADRAAGLNRLSRFLAITPFSGDVPDMHARWGAKMKSPAALASEDARYLAGLYREGTAELEAMLGRAVPWPRY